MENIDIEKVKDKWISLIEKVKMDIKEDELQKLTTDEKVCLYAEYHSLNETLSICSSSNVFGAAISNITNDVKSMSTLPVSLKILTWFSLENDLKNVYISSSPRYDTPYGKTIQVGDLSFSKPINKNDQNLQQTMDKIIYDEMIKYFRDNNDKTIYIYMIIQNIKIIENISNGGSTLVWTSRLYAE
jgi:hypothetical protein